MTLNLTLRQFCGQTRGGARRVGRVLIVLIVIATLHGPMEPALGQRSGDTGSLELLRQADSAAGLGTEAGTRSAIALAGQVSESSAAELQAWTRLRALTTIAGRYLELTRLDSVIHFGRRAHDLARAEGLRDWQAAASGILAIAYALLSRSDSALVHAGTLLDQCDAVCALVPRIMTRVSRVLPDSMRMSLLATYGDPRRTPDPEANARALDELGLLYTESLRMPDSALILHRRVDALRRVDTWTLYGMGRAFRALGSVDSAGMYFDLMLADARRKGARWHEAYALGNIAQMCHRDLAVADQACAATYYDSTVTLAASLLAQLDDDDNRTTAAEYAAEIYEDFVLLIAGWSQTDGHLPPATASLAVAEYGRATALLGSVGSAQVREGDRVASRVTASARRDSLSFLKVLEPVTYSLSYLVTSDTLLIWLASPNGGVRLHRKPIRADSLTSLARRAREAIGADAAFLGARLRGERHATKGARMWDHGMEGALNELADVLVPKVVGILVPSGADLVIVPHHVLTLLPFGLLAVPGTTEMLGGRFAIRYAPSLKALEALMDRHRERTALGGAERPFLVVSDPSMPSVDMRRFFEDADSGLVALAPLPAAASEGRWLEREVGATHLKGEGASESRVRREMIGARVIHLATHAVVPEFSDAQGRAFLALAPDGRHDGQLSATELLNDPTIELNASLVVLSACQTAIGPLRWVEGSLGLQRAFLFKGAESVIASLWSVNDESTAKLMRAFYTHWMRDTDQPTKAEALRRAQMDVRRTPGFEHPLYWAGFEVIGLN